MALAQELAEELVNGPKEKPVKIVDIPNPSQSDLENIEKFLCNKI